MSPSSEELDSLLPDDINAELALWKQLAFGMPSPADHHRPAQTLSNDESTPPSSSQIPSPHFHVLPHTAPPSLPPETYNLLIHALLSLQGSASHAYPQTSPPTYPYSVHSSSLPDYHFPWPPGTAPSVSAASITGPSSFYPTNPPLPLPPSASFSQLTSSPAASTTAPTAQDPEGTEDAMSGSEDKRRRNTAASARFRLKKKLNTLNLEHTVTDLTGRTEELEREATDLRRENAWLKEIVLLKSRSLAALNVGGSRHDEDEKDDRTHAESEPKSTVKRREKGKDKER